MVFKSRNDNTGTCYLGGSDVSSTDGISLVPGESIQLELANAIKTDALATPDRPKEKQVMLRGPVLINHGPEAR